MRTIEDKGYLSKVRLDLKKLLRSDFSYGLLSDELGVSKGCLWRFVNRGYLPKDKRKQIALGVNCIKVDIIPCSNCGGVHTRKCAKPKLKRQITITKDLATMIWWMKELRRLENG